MGQEHPVSIWKLDRIMVTVRDVPVDPTEFAHATVDGFRPDPSAVVFHVLIEGQLGSWKYTYRYRWITFQSEAAGRRSTKGRGDKRLSSFGGTRCYCM
jgi:hypothetical protein